MVQRYGAWFIYDIKMQIRADRMAISLIRYDLSIHRTYRQEGKEDMGERHY